MRAARLWLQIGVGLAEDRRLVLAHAGHEQVVARIEDLGRDGEELIGRLALPEDHLRRALPQSAVVIDGRDADVAERQLLERSHRLVDVELPRLHLGEELADLVGAHPGNMYSSAGRPSSPSLTGAGVSPRLGAVSQTDEHASNKDVEGEIAQLRGLAERVVERALSRGANVAEAVARSGSELSTKVRLGEPELVEEAGYRSIGLKVIKDQRVALLSTSDLTEAGLDRFIDDAQELVEVSQEDPFAGPADPELIAKDVSIPDDLYDPAIVNIGADTALDWAKRGEAAAMAADERIDNSNGSTFSRVTGAFAMVLSGGFSSGYATSYASLVVSPVVEDEDNKKRRGFHWTARRHLADLDAAEEVGQEAARRTLRKLGAKKVPSCEAPVIFDPTPRGPSSA